MHVCIPIRVHCYDKFHIPSIHCIAFIVWLCSCHLFHGDFRDCYLWSQCNLGSWHYQKAPIQWAGCVFLLSIQITRTHTHTHKYKCTRTQWNPMLFFGFATVYIFPMCFEPPILLMTYHWKGWLKIFRINWSNHFYPLLFLQPNSKMFHF